MYNEFDNLYLTREEKHIIKVLSKQQRVAEKEFDGQYLYNLIRLGFVSLNYLKERDREGSSIPDGTVSLTDTYQRYNIYKRRRLFEKKLPIVISVIALLKSFEGEIISIMQWLVQLMK